MASQQSVEADKVWALEKAYWRYVQSDDLTGYRSLWHPSFLGWPYVSPEPPRKRSHHRLDHCFQKEW